MSLRGLAGITALLVAAIVPAAAQEWPARPIAMVVPYAAGGPPDVIARIIAPGMSESLGVQVVVENVSGAGGITGSARVARAAPDGYVARERYQRLGNTVASPAQRSPEYLGAFIRSEIDKWAGPIRASGVSLE